MSRKTLALVVLGVFLFFAAASPAGPKFTGIVASQSLLAQSSNLSAFTLFTPDTDGLFRVTILIEDQFGGGAGDANPSISWTDAYSRSHSQNISGSSAVVGGELVVRVKATTSISLNTSTINPAVPVDIYGIVERLQ